MELPPSARMNPSILTVVACLSLGATWANGATYHVAPTGNDANPGTLEAPWRTAGRAAAALRAGDTAYFRAGQYNSRLIPEASGTDDAHWITFAAYPGETATLDGSGVDVPIDEGLIYIESRSYIRISGLRIVNSTHAGIWADRSSWLHFSGLHTIDTSSSGIGVWGCDHVTIDGNEIERACGGGAQECITVAGTDVFDVLNNEVHHGLKEGICLKDGSSHGTAHRNHVHDMQRLGIYVDAWDKHTFDIDVFRNVVHGTTNDGITTASEMGGLLENVLIYDNVCYGNAFNGIGLNRNGPAAVQPMRNIQVVNNTLYGNGTTWGGGICVGNTDVEGVVIRNNVCSQNVWFQIVVTSGARPAEVVIDHNLVDGYREYEEETRGVAWVEGSPRFVDAGRADFHLQAGSPAIDAGVAEGAPTEDFDGTSRPRDGNGDGAAAFDLGAFEAGPGASGSEIVVGLGSYPAEGGRVYVTQDGTRGFVARAWIRTFWNAYNATNGETRAACGDTDGDGLDEVFVGTGRITAGGGWISVLDDGEHGHALIRWLRVPWTAYDSANGETWPACGDLDGDGRAELVVGLGTYTALGGYLAVFEDGRAGYGFFRWLRLPWAAYNAADGQTRPACGDLDGDRRAEILVGLGRYPQDGGRVAVFGSAAAPYTLSGWLRLSSSAYNATNGETWPACGDVDGDGRDEVLLGTGSYPQNGGWVSILGDARSSFSQRAWVRVAWGAYNQANGEVRPACGDLDGNGADEVVLGLGRYAMDGGWMQVRGGASSGFALRRWLRLPWAAYNAADGSTRPVAGNVGR